MEPCQESHLEGWKDTSKGPRRERQAITQRRIVLPRREFLARVSLRNLNKCPKQKESALVISTNERVPMSHDTRTSKLSQALSPDQKQQLLNTGREPPRSWTCHPFLVQLVSLREDIAGEGGIFNFSEFGISIFHQVRNFNLLT